MEIGQFYYTNSLKPSTEIQLTVKVSWLRPQRGNPFAFNGIGNVSQEDPLPSTRGRSPWMGPCESSCEKFRWQSEMFPTGPEKAKREKRKEKNRQTDRQTDRCHELLIITPHMQSQCLTFRQEDIMANAAT